MSACQELGKRDDENTRDDESRAEQKLRAERFAEDQHAEGNRNDQAQFVDRRDSRCRGELQRAVITIRPMNASTINVR